MPCRAAIQYPARLRLIAAGSTCPRLCYAPRRCAVHTEMLDRLVTPWLQQLDAELFPLKQPLDARLNAMLASTFADNHWLAILANALIGCIGEAIASYRVMFDKDALHHESVPLGIDTAAIPAGAFDRSGGGIARLEPVAEAAPEVSDTLRWRYVGQAVVFRYTMLLPINYEFFVRKVDIARTIQFMNDYLGGVVVPLLHDDAQTSRQTGRTQHLPAATELYRAVPGQADRCEQAGSRRIRGPIGNGSTGRRSPARTLRLPMTMASPPSNATTTALGSPSRVASNSPCRYSGRCSISTWCPISKLRW